MCNEMVQGLAKAFYASAASAAAFERQISAIKVVQKANKRHAKRLSKKALRLGKDTTFSSAPVDPAEMGDV